MKRNAAEWGVLAVAVASIVVLVAVLVLEGLREVGPPNPTVVLNESQARQGALGWIIPATIRNDGEEAAEQVMIEATAEVAGERESSQLMIQFLPAGTAVEGAFSFSAQPSGPVEVRLLSFVVP